MKYKIILSFLCLVIVLMSVSSFSTNSSTYNSDVITSSGGRNTGSGSYSTDIITGTITGFTASSNYNNSLGFFYGAGGVAGAVNHEPNDPPISINSTDGSNYENQNLNCFAIITDNDTNENLDVAVQWYKNNILNLTVDLNNSYSNGTFFNAILDSGNTSVGDNWKCGMRLYDGSAYSNWINSSSLIIVAVPVVLPAQPSGGGGGAPITSIAKPKISVEPQELNINLIVNTSKKEIITVTNIDTKNLTLKISQKNLDNMVFFEETSFEFSSGESKTLNVVFVAPEKAGIYTGKIIIGDKEILVSLTKRNLQLLSCSLL